jgi:excisionase family DNA binding protein
MNTSDSLPLLVDIPNACRLTSIGRTKLYELLASNTLPSRRIGGKRLIAVDDLRAYIASVPVGYVPDDAA